MDKNVQSSAVHNFHYGLYVFNVANWKTGKLENKLASLLVVSLS